MDIPTLLKTTWHHGFAKQVLESCRNTDKGALSDNVAGVPFGCEPPVPYHGQAVLVQRDGRKRPSEEGAMHFKMGGFGKGWVFPRQQPSIAYLCGAQTNADDATGFKIHRYSLVIPDVDGVVIKRPTQAEKKLSIVEKRFSTVGNFEFVHYRDSNLDQNDVPYKCAP